jgi:octaprenyl-diphosphate synthase
MGKNTGDDLREGKMTLPMILALADGNPTERELLVSALGDTAADAGRLRQVLHVFDRYDTLGRTVERAHEHARRAREALKPLPPGELKALLGDVAEFAVARAY